MACGGERGNYGVEIGFGAAHPRVLRVKRRDSHLALGPYRRGNTRFGVLEFIVAEPFSFSILFRLAPAHAVCKREFACSRCSTRSAAGQQPAEPAQAESRKQRRERGRAMVV